MGTCFLYGNGGGSDLNFKVVGGTTQPSSPSKNTIWVNTGTAITGWVFSADAPSSPTAGVVWFKTGFGRSVPFNALKKNEVQVCPESTQQYVSGSWAEKTAMIYSDGAWSLFHPSSEYLIKDGVIDMTAHPATVTENSGDNAKATNGVTYNNKPALQMSGRNGLYCTHSFANVAVPSWATVFSVEIYYIPAYDGNPSINIGGASVTISRGSSDSIIDKTVSIDVSSISGTTGNLKFRFQGCAYNDVCYIGNAWFE